MHSSPNLGRNSPLMFLPTLKKNNYERLYNKTKNMHQPHLTPSSHLPLVSTPTPRCQRCWLAASPRASASRTPGPKGWSHFRPYRLSSPRRCALFSQNPTGWRLASTNYSRAKTWVGIFLVIPSRWLKKSKTIVSYEINSSVCL